MLCLFCSNFIFNLMCLAVINALKNVMIAGTKTLIKLLRLHVDVPLSSSAKAVFASCQLSAELLEDFSPKFINPPKLNVAAILNHISHNSTPACSAGYVMLPAHFELFPGSFDLTAVALLKNLLRFSWNETKMTLLSSILQRQLVPSPVRRGECWNVE